MRGKIIQYNGADGTGTIVAADTQYHFALAAWRGERAPVINKTVEIELEGETVTTVVAVGEDVLIKEKAAELGGKARAQFNKLRASTSATAAGNGTVDADASAGGETVTPGAAMVQSVIARYGKLVLGAYVLFLLGTLVFNAVSVALGPGMGGSLFGIANLLSQFGASGGMIKVMLLLGYASIVLPILWRDRRAWLALVLPLLAVLWVIFSALHAIGSMGHGAGSGMSDFFSIGFGFYLSLAAAIVLAVLGIKRFLSEV